eukprot:c26173_g1_i1 orf=946-1836(+)
MMEVGKATSMYSGSDRVACMKQAARRSQFIARIQKYEAKVKQERKARELLLREHKPAILEQEAGTLEQKPSLIKKMILQEPIELLSECKTFNLGECEPISEGKGTSACQHQAEEKDHSREQKTISEGRNSSTVSRPVGPKLNSAEISGGKAFPRNSQSAPETAALHHMGRTLSGEVSGQDSAILKVKSSAAADGNVASTTSALKVRLKAADMHASMQEHAFRCARETLDNLVKLQCKHVAYTLKKEFDMAYGPAWHCIVGTSFGSYVTHSLGGFVYFSIDKVSVLLFKTTVEPMDS